MTITTIYGDAADGHVRSENAVYATARTGGTLTTFNAVIVNVGQDTPYWVFQTLLAFDTSGLSAITSATLDLWLTSDNSPTDLIVEARIKDWGISVDTGDWVSGDDLAALPLVATLASSGIGGTGAYKRFTDVNLGANINTSGFTRIILASDRQRVGNTPTTGEYLSFSSADEAGTAQDPKLTVVTYSPPVTRQVALGHSQRMG